MNQSLENNNFLYVPGFITTEHASFLAKQFIEFEKTGLCIKDPQAPNSPAFYNFKPFLELLCEKTTEVKSLIEESVLPTYTYARIYKNGEVLKSHRDRPACEISLTVHLDGDCQWPIFIQKPNNSAASLNLNKGDAMIYLGCVADHWREEFLGEQYVQVFLHYVRSNGPCNWAYFDKKQ